MTTVGLIPAAGKAQRLFPIPCSKEIYPIGYNLDGHPEVISNYLIERMSRSSDHIHMIVGTGKSDIIEYYARRSLFRPIVFQMIDNSNGMPYTLDLAYPFVRDETILFGMPDTIFTPEDAYLRLLQRMRMLGSDIVFGLFPVYYPKKFSTVILKHEVIVESIITKHDAGSNMIWGCAVWGPSFTQFMHDFMDEQQSFGEMHIDEVFRSAIENGLRVHAFPFYDGTYMDIGSPGDLREIEQYLINKEEP